MQTRGFEVCKRSRGGDDSMTYKHYEYLPYELDLADAVEAFECQALVDRVDKAQELYGSTTNYLEKESSFEGGVTRLITFKSIDGETVELYWREDKEMTQ
jgi:hypothetical protein